MSLFLISLPLRRAALALWAGERGWTRPQGGDFDEGRALHHLLSESFGKGALQPFRLMVPRGRDAGRLYAYAATDAPGLRDMAAAIAPPEALAVVNPAALQAKPMPGFQPGQRLGVDVLARPVRRLRQPLGRFGAGDEIDCWLHQRLLANPEADPDGGARHDRSPAYLDWLAERLTHAGAELDRDASRVAAMQRRRVARGGKAVEGPEVGFHATVTIRDPQAFRAALARGLGRHCAYGYGMMLLRAPNAPPPEG